MPQQRGDLAGIAWREKPFAPMEEVRSCTVAESGLQGDFRAKDPGGSRAVTLLFEDQWREVCEELGQSLSWTSRRANFLIRGMSNPGAAPQRIRVGGVVLEVTGVCDPCSRMDRAWEGLRATLAKRGRGGLTCRVVEAGNASLGDRIAVFAVPAPDRSGEGRDLPSEVLRFWFEEVPPERRFQVDENVDRVIRDRFSALHDAALAGALESWEEEAERALALLILLDQFSRNLFRGDGRAFAADAAARGIAHRSIARGFDRAVGEEKRMFFYLPFMHSEDLVDQDRCVALVRENLPNNELGLYHAGKHREVIARFGRFPHRNEVMGRPATEDEAAFLAGGGYAP